MQNLTRKAIILACLLVVITAGVPAAAAGPDPVGGNTPTDYVHCAMGHKSYCARTPCEMIECPFLIADAGW